MKEAEIIDAIKDIEKLKDRKREGWEIRALPSESIADHITGTCLFSLILTKKIEKKTETEKVMKFCLLHDYPEAKISDLDQISKKYLNKEEGEKKAIQKSPNFFQKIFEEYKETDSIEKKIVDDADKLDMINRASKLEKIGYSKEILSDFYKNLEFNFEISKKIFELIKSN